MTTTVPPITLTDLHPFEYEHPYDAKALDALQNMTGLDLLVRKCQELSLERMAMLANTGSALRVTKTNYPKIHALLDQVCDVINLPVRPGLYLSWGYEVNACTTGVEHPIIVLNSGAVDLLTEPELLYLIGHEVGHIKSRHMLFNLMTQVLVYFGTATFGIGGILTKPIQIALMLWSRMSELTADRAGLLTCQDLDIATRANMKMSGLPIRYYDEIHPESFIQQARDFDHLDYDSLNKVLKMYLVMDQSHPWTVMRAAELLRWKESGAYDWILRRETRDRVKKRYEDGSIFCRKCGYRLIGSETFCSNCGEDLTVKPVQG